MNTSKKRVLLVDTIRSNILEKSSVKDKKRATEIAREWIRKYA